MATQVKIGLLSCLLLLIIVMEEVKPVLTKQGERKKPKEKILEESIKKLEERIKALEECKGKCTHFPSYVLANVRDSSYTVLNLYRSHHSSSQ